MNPLFFPLYTFKMCEVLGMDGCHYTVYTAEMRASAYLCVPYTVGAIHYKVCFRLVQLIHNCFSKLIEVIA